MLLFQLLSKSFGNLGGILWPNSSPISLDGTSHLCGSSLASSTLHSGRASVLYEVTAIAECGFEVVRRLGAAEATIVELTIL